MTVIRVATDPQNLKLRGRFADGTSALLRDVELDFDGDRLVIRGHGVHERWRCADVREVPGPRGQTCTLACADTPLARLYMENRFLARRLPNLRRPLQRSRKRWIWAWGLAAAASVVLLMTVMMPLVSMKLAPLIPEKAQAQLGQAAVLDLRTSNDRILALCDAPEGRAALDQILARLLKTTTPQLTANVLVLDHPLINAFALPDDQIVLFRGFLQAARRPDEVAAVIAHELGHLHHSDPTRDLLRWGGALGILDLFFGELLGGSATVTAFNRIITSRERRQAESKADAFAIDVLIRADISPVALIEFFTTFNQGPKIEPTDNAVWEYLNTHPPDSLRIERAQAAIPKGFEGTEIIGSNEWLAIQRICD